MTEPPDPNDPHNRADSLDDEDDPEEIAEQERLEAERQDHIERRAAADSSEQAAQAANREQFQDDYHKALVEIDGGLPRTDPNWHERYE